jgi:hypothetical protein
MSKVGEFICIFLLGKYLEYNNSLILNKLHAGQWVKTNVSKKSKT